MAREIDKIITSKTAPKDKNVIWDDGKTLNIFRKGKWESTGLTSEQQDMIQKLLDSYGDLPEDLDTLKEIANTPADFLNNNNELGGIINMPFGYTNKGSIKQVELKDDIIIYGYDPDGNGRTWYNLGQIPSYYYGKVAINVKLRGNTNFAFNTYHILDISTLRQSVTNDSMMYLKVDNNNNLLIAIFQGKNSKVYFTGLTGYTDKLPLSFTTPYIVGNDTQEHLDELKRLCSNSDTKHIPEMIIRVKTLGVKILTNVTLGGPPNFWAFEGVTIDNNLVSIVFPSKDISSLEVNQNVEDIGATVTVTSLSPTPDWDVEEGEEGYIKNRTHYSKKVNIVTVSKENITSTPYKIRPMSPGLYYEENGVERYITLNPQSKINDEDIEWKDFSASGPPIQLALNNAFLYIKDRFNYPRDNFTFWNESVNRLDEKFIPNTIARVADYELPHIKLDISQTDSNVTKLTDNSISLTDRCVCDLYDGSYSKELALIHNGELYNGVITGIKEGKLVQYDVNFKTGEITQKLSIDLELIGGEVKLDVCTAGSTEAFRNLELLNKAYFALGDHFTVNIDAGIGVAKFIPESGGEGHITTAAGVNVHYTIGNDGSVVKTNEVVLESTYDYYTSSGGTLSEDKWKKCQKYAYEPFMISSTGTTTIPDDLLNSGGTSWFIDFYWKYCFLTGGIPIKTVQWEGNIPKKFAPVYDDSQTYTIDFANKTITKD